MPETMKVGIARLHSRTPCHCCLVVVPSFTLYHKEHSWGDGGSTLPESNPKQLLPYDAPWSNAIGWRKLLRKFIHSFSFQCDQTVPRGHTSSGVAPRVACPSCWEECADWPSSQTRFCGLWNSDSSALRILHRHSASWLLPIRKCAFYSCLCEDLLRFKLKHSALKSELLVWLWIKAKTNKQKIKQVTQQKLSSLKSMWYTSLRDTVIKISVHIVDSINIC